MPWTERILHTLEPDFTLWKSYYDRLETKGIYHSPEYIKVLEQYYQDEAELFIFEYDNKYIYYPYFKKRLDKLLILNKHRVDNMQDCYDIVSSWYYGGPLCNDSKYDKALFYDFLEAFHVHAKHNKIVTEFVRFDANLNNYLYYPTEMIQFDRETVFVDLSKSVNAIWNDFSSANQRCIQKASRNNFKIFTVQHSDDDTWKKFYGIYNSEMLRKNAPKHLCFTYAFFRELKQNLKGNIVLLAVEREGEFCGGFIIIFDDYFAFHFLSATSQKFWAQRVNNLLYYESILWAKEKGFHIFDFMGGRPGVFRFKKNFSSSRKKFFTYKKIHNKSIYDQLISTYTACNPSSNEENYFPAYRTPS